MTFAIKKINSHPIFKRGDIDTNYQQRRDSAMDIFDNFMGDWPALFERSPMQQADLCPNMNISETDHSYEFDTELPGVEKGNVALEIKDNALIIKGDKKTVDEEQNDHYFRVERSSGSFYRKVDLPTDIDKERVHANLNDGVLHISIEKSAATDSTNRKISIAS